MPNSSMATKRRKSAPKKQTVPTVSAADGRDRISELPDEILHSILRRIHSPVLAGTTIALSRRWRTLWSSYPSVKFGEARDDENFQKFIDSSIDRFSRHKLLRIETLDLSLRPQSDDHSAIERLLKFASERKPEEISVSSIPAREIRIPCRLLSDSCAKILRLNRIQFAFDSEPIAIRQFRFLQTLELGEILQLDKLRISDVPNLTTLTILRCYRTKAIEIEAPRLQTLKLGGLTIAKLELVAPELNRFEIKDAYFQADNLRTAISNLGTLKTLILDGLHQFEQSSWELEHSSPRLELSSPKLEVLQLLRIPSQLKEIEIEAGLPLSRFVLRTRHPGALQKCAIRNAIACRSEVDIVIADTLWSFLGSTKSFVAGFPQFRTVNLTVSKDDNLPPLNPEEVDGTMHPTAVHHLKLVMKFPSTYNQADFFQVLFRTCHPKFLTVIHENERSLTFFRNLTSLMSRIVRREYWPEDVKIVMRDVDRTLKKEEEELMDVTTDMAQSLAEQKRVCFMLTWN